MRLKNYSPLLITILFLWSCQKEQSFDSSVPGQNNPQGKLLKMVYTYSPGDSSVTNFQYDGAGRLSGLSNPSGDVLMQGITNLRIVRDGAGFIQSYTLSDANSSGQGDRVFKVYYDQASKRYKARTGMSEFNGTEVIDSTVFEYEGDRIITVRTLIKATVDGPAGEFAKTDIFYDASGNITTARTSIINLATNIVEPAFEILLQYDTKINPLKLGMEGLVLDYLYGVNAGNVVKIAQRELMNGSEPEEYLTGSYTYRTDGKPATAVLTSDSQSVDVAYSYQ